MVIVVLSENVLFFFGNRTKIRTLEPSHRSKKEKDKFYTDAKLGGFRARTTKVTHPFALLSGHAQSVVGDR